MRKFFAIFLCIIFLIVPVGYCYELDSDSDNYVDLSLMPLDELWTFQAGVTISTGKNLTVGTTQWNSGDYIDGDQIKDDTIDDDSLDFTNITSTDLTFDADSVISTAVYSGTTSLEEITAADDSGASIVGVYPEFDNSSSDNVQDVLDDLDAAITSAGGGDITAVGPGYATGGAFTGGVVSTGTTMFIWEGTTSDDYELSIISPSADPASDINITLPSASGTLLCADGVGTTLTALNGDNIQADTIDDDSINFTDVTSSDLTFDADSVALTAVYSGTTSLEETTAADDSGAYLIGTYDEFANSNSSNVQDVLDDLDAAIAGIVGGDITSVGDCTASEALDGSATGGTYIRIYDGDSHYLELNPGDLTANKTLATRDASGTILISGDALTGDVTATFDTDGSTATSLANDSVAIDEMADSDHGFFTYASGVASLDTGGLTSANLLGALTNETGTGVSMFNISPTTTGTMIAENIDGSGTISANLFTPDAADGAALGSGALEFSDLFLAASGVIYGENDQSNTLTSSATGWVANLNFYADTYGSDGSVTDTELKYIDFTSSGQTQLDARCLESVFGTAIGTGLLLDSTDLKVSAILQEYNAVDPSTFAKTIFDDADAAAVRATIGVAESNFTIGTTIQETGSADATPDVSNAASGSNNVYRANENGTITDFDDTDDHSEFSDGDFFIFIVDDASTVIDFSENANIEGNAGVDFTGSATQNVTILFMYHDARWNAVNFTSGFSTPTTLGLSSIDLGSGAIATTGLLTGGTKTVVDADGGDADAYCYGGVWMATGAGIIALPAVAVGMQITIENHTAGDVTLEPDGTDAIKLNGAAILADGVNIVGTDIGDSCVLTYMATGDWSAWHYGYAEGS